ncbi:hypothetical protein [Eisenbergiella sp.]|uniref:hypothetical protein n=1 Tax=Eisenbergiella sp. TaxID=1924109 RepID=UPI0020885539|nr:hypothetical protein [Eisenbergiella sp.]BDF47912.1 hypothetical protein CE91St56_50350 [Lachnospiraceae bacterium]GKH43987.1 hypothetical protein CE91St57_49610 [Lachnospiraceae bacterium]
MAAFCFSVITARFGRKGGYDAEPETSRPSDRGRWKWECRQPADFGAGGLRGARGFIGKPCRLDGLCRRGKAPAGPVDTASYQRAQGRDTPQPTQKST